MWSARGSIALEPAVWRADSYEPRPWEPAPGRESGRPTGPAVSGLRRALASSGELEVLLHLGTHIGHVRAVLREAAVVVTVLAPVRLAVEVVVAGCALLVAGGRAPVGNDLLHPPLFS